jgi:hypothetical protein
MVRHGRRCTNGRNREPKSYAVGSLNRLLVELAIATNIPMSEWHTAEQILTAIEILEKRYGK